ncbi:MAG: site-specific integrase [Spirochaetales bacterium]|nr:site-specific integrase [Spirochaetales bacterium]
MKKSVYITYRKNGDKKTPQIIFNDPSSGERMAVLSVPALYKRVYAGDYRKLNNLPSNDYWTEKRIMDLVIKALDKGLIKKNGRVKDSLSFIEYATKIWTFEDSPRVARLNREKSGSLHKSHADDVLGALKKHAFPCLPDDLLLDEFSFVQAEKIKDYMLEKGVSNSTINKVMSGIRVVLDEAFRTGLVSANESERIRNVRTASESYGVLTKAETQVLLAYLDETYPVGTYERYRYLTVAVALQSCAREGEIVVLRPSSLRKYDSFYTIDITSSWNSKEGEKSPKNGKARESVLSLDLGEELLEYAKSNPYQKDDGYIFFSELDPSKPLDKDLVREGFYETLEKALGMNYEERVDRNITFHSLRHTAIVSLNQVTSKREIKLATGHSSDAVFNVYAGHQTEEDLKKLADAMNDLKYTPKHIREKGWNNQNEESDDNE